MATTKRNSTKSRAAKKTRRKKKSDYYESMSWLFGKSMRPTMAQKKKTRAYVKELARTPSRSKRLKKLMNPRKATAKAIPGAWITAKVRRVKGKVQIKFHPK